MIFNYFESEKKLLYFEHGVETIPDEIIAEFSEKDVTHVDFSSNSLASLDCISHFSTLEEIIFDNNFLSDATQFPTRKFPNIVVLSLNNNKFENLTQLLHNLVRCFPNIRYLSLLGNSLCPALLQDCSEDEYKSYRLSIISRMPKLRFLDAKQVDKNELQVQATNSHNDHASDQSTTDLHKDKMESFGKIKRFFGFYPREETARGTGLDQRSAYNPLPVDDIGSSTAAHKTLLGKVKNHYEGSQSQGNRFILNQDL